MRKYFVVLAIGMLFAGCVQNFCEVSINSVTNIQNEMIQEERAKTVVLNMLNQIDPQTRNTVRKIASVETITFDQIFRNRTR